MGQPQKGQEPKTRGGGRQGKSSKGLSDELQLAEKPIPVEAAEVKNYEETKEGYTYLSGNTSSPNLWLRLEAISLIPQCLITTPPVYR